LGRSLTAVPDRSKCNKLAPPGGAAGSSAASKSRSAANPKASVMSDNHPQAKLKELIERASIAAEINFKKGNEVAPKGFAIRENGSRFVFKPIPAASKAETASMIRAIFAQQKVVSYVLTMAAYSEGKQFVLFSAEDETGMMFGQREIIMRPAPHLAPLEIPDRDIAEGRIVGLLPHRAPTS
jgi:hypothetical protein